jgi:hypothetical protein
MKIRQINFGELAKRQVTKKSPPAVSTSGKIALSISPATTGHLAGGNSMISGFFVDGQDLNSSAGNG